MSRRHGKFLPREPRNPIARAALDRLGPFRARSVKPRKGMGSYSRKGRSSKGERPFDFMIMRTA